MSTDTNLLTRVVAAGDEGEDVYGCKRGIIRLLKLGTLDELESKPPAVQQRFQAEWTPTVRRAQAELGLPPDGKIGPATERAMRKAKAFDAKAKRALTRYREEHLRPRIVYPHAAGFASSVCQGLHQTAGIDGNWAYDFCAPGGTPVVACFAAEIVKLSGRDPNGPWDNRVGIGGWSIHYWSPDNVYRAFSTHYGVVTVRVGQNVKPGDVIGRVASWPGDPGRSHTHLGLTSERGEDDAINLIGAISRAPRWKVGI